MQAKDGLGHYGERVASRFLVEQGYQILATNWRCSDGELDVVAKRDETVCFVEVKTRSSDRFGEPSEAVGPVKQRKIRDLAVKWLAEAGLDRCSLSFDVVEVRHRAKGAAEVTHLREAF